MCACLGSVSPAGAVVRYVDSAAAPGGDGLAWATAYDSMSDALGAAQPGDQIWVAGGRYMGRFTLALDVELYGGFAGTETELTQRDWKANPTILDGNRTGSVVTSPVRATGTTRIDGFTITNGSGTWSGSQSRGGGLYLDKSSPTIANNTIMGNFAYYGGALYVSNDSSPTVVSNTISGNGADYGGGVYLYHSFGTITNNTIAGNDVYIYISSFGGGAGLYLVDSSPTITNNTITGNSASSAQPWFWDASGGGLYLSRSSPTIANNTIMGNDADYGGGLNLVGSRPTITSNTITGNSADREGGGLSLNSSSPTIANNTIAANGASVGGGGLSLNSSSPTIADNTITGNIAPFGGGLYQFRSSPTIVNNKITGNGAYDGGGLAMDDSSPTIANNTITGNFAYYGGALYVRNDSSPTIANNTIMGNSADREGGGLYLIGYGSPMIANTIVVFNSSGIYVTITMGRATLWYNCVYGNAAYDYSGLTDPTGTDGNISADPIFGRNPSDGGDGWGDDPDTPGVDEGANDDFGDLQLRAASPCIDAGDNAAVPADTPDLDGDGDVYEPLPFDLVGGVRFVDDPRAVDTGSGTPPIVDMGAYESRWVCGNGVIEGAEECDDGNVDPDDGCDSECHFYLGDHCLVPFEASLGTNVGPNSWFGADDREASCRADSNHDAWFEYQAACTGTHVIDTQGTALEPTNDTVLSVYDACDGNELACDDNGGDGNLSKLTFEAEEDTTYYIRVGGVGDNAGGIVLNIATIGRCRQVREPERVDPALRKQVRREHRNRR